MARFYYRRKTPLRYLIGAGVKSTMALVHTISDTVTSTDRTHSVTIDNRQKPQLQPAPLLSPQLDFLTIPEDALNMYWNQVFTNTLKHFIGNYHDLAKNSNSGLVYYLIINGQIRYVGQTREIEGLTRRMTRQRQYGYLGYRDYIKRHILRAVSKNEFSIITKSVDVSQLDRFEKDEIVRFGWTGKLWNQKDNPNYRSEYDDVPVRPKVRCVI